MVDNGQQWTMDNGGQLIIVGNGQCWTIDNGGHWKLVDNGHWLHMLQIVHNGPNELRGTFCALVFIILQFSHLLHRRN